MRYLFSYWSSSRASVTDPKTWTSFNEAHTAFLGNGDPYSGVGFVLTENDSFYFLDWDDIRDVTTGAFNPEIRARLPICKATLRFLTVEKAPM